MDPASGYLAPIDEVRVELREKGSRFLAIACPVADEDAVRARVKEFQQCYAGATHLCWAWRVGGRPREGRSDAGEPSGTAGEPILRVLQGAGLSDALVVVARWFGGVKLGKGGLARAYGAAARLAVERLRVGERQPSVRLRVSLPYRRIGDLRRLVQPPAVEIVGEDYGETAVVVLKVYQARAGEIEDSLAALGISAERLA